MNLMNPIPEQEDNPHGFNRRYCVTKADGSPVDPDAQYFVLRLDSGCKDADHLKACRLALAVYAANIKGTAPQLASELRAGLLSLWKGEQ